LLHHDNASSHTIKFNKQFLEDNKVKIIGHPPYSPDLTMSDFWLFPGLKRHLRGQYIRLEEALNTALLAYFKSVAKDIWLEAFEMCKKRKIRTFN